MKKDPLLILASDRRDFERYIFTNKLPRKDVIFIFHPRQLMGRLIQSNKIVRTENYLDNVNKVLEMDLIRGIV